MITLENLKVGTQLIKTVYGKPETWTITNITAKNIMYSTGKSHVFQYNVISIERFSIKKFLELANGEWSNGAVTLRMKN